MKKISLTFITAIFATFSLSAFSAPANQTKVIPQQCEQLFKEAENLIADAEKQPGTHTQISKMKNKLNQSKKQILEMELATQTKSCNQGLAKLNSLKQQQPD
ncbi:DUF5339 domain-containing protein [Conservatibacter flavescens]|uniref:Recombinase XerD n=1 Tax=Conservatibacter flavescens TaxID=28161 RepID=A0A2M8S0M5_9PAST|nr:DUF5339 domain-containing protein [Conservatibacter flavescens]PJG84702.1 recombinase XerD [Conservatibacter flavescens]